MTFKPTVIDDVGPPDVSVVVINPQPIYPRYDIGLWIDPDRLREILGEAPREPNRA